MSQTETDTSSDVALDEKSVTVTPIAQIVGISVIAASVVRGVEVGVTKLLVKRANRKAVKAAEKATTPPPTQI